ncbi:btk-binding protein-related [Anaeramoeba flamelloides]|uniref:Btk-binding protein-related n=1 Tax=Anaeramoeba flamelloides TaxID=1746091 RepID=A0AAV7YVJ1_9EUKA|nr:btk-binding protein-related [Anaeramoeba flamelloides]
MKNQKKQTSEIYSNGRKPFEKMGDNHLSRWVPIEKIQKVKKVVTTMDTFLILKQNNELVLLTKNKQFTSTIAEIKDIRSSNVTYLVLTKLGKVYSLDPREVKSPISVTSSNTKPSKIEQLKLVDYFEKQNLSVESINMNKDNSYYVCQGNKLYANGLNSSGQIGFDENPQILPRFIANNVVNVYCGVFGNGVFYTTTEDTVFATGWNYWGQLSLNHKNNQTRFVKVPNWKASDILDIQTHQFHTVLLTKDGKLYSTGAVAHNGNSKSTTGLDAFTEIPYFEKKKVIQISGGDTHSIVLTDKNELYGWGFKNNTQNTDQDSDVTIIRDNRKVYNIKFPSNILENNNKIKISSGGNSILIYQSYDNNDLKQDFINLFMDRKFTDHLFLEKYPIHKILIERRTGLQIDQIETIFKEKLSLTNEDINSFLEWIYVDVITNRELLEKIFNSLNLAFSPNEVEHSLENDLIKLYNDQDSTDFTLLSKIEDDDNDGNDDDDDDEQFEEIPVHKFILIARSGLFRDLFENVQEESSSVKDYSGKSIESIEILIKFFYTNTILLTADHDPQLVVEELEDAVEYYQLNDVSNLINELHSIKKFYNLK